jgi:hypothetical protein
VKKTRSGSPFYILFTSPPHSSNKLGHDRWEPPLSYVERIQKGV